MGDAGPLPALGWESLALSFVSLGVVCLVAYLALRLLAGRRGGSTRGGIRVLARCPLEPRRSVYLIEAAGRCFLVGVGEGAMALLAEVDRDDGPEAPGQTSSTSGRFAAVLARVVDQTDRPAP